MNNNFSTYAVADIVREMEDRGPQWLELSPHPALLCTEHHGRVAMAGGELDLRTRFEVYKCSEARSYQASSGTKCVLKPGESLSNNIWSHMSQHDTRECVAAFVTVYEEKGAGIWMRRSEKAYIDHVRKQAIPKNSGFHAQADPITETEIREVIQEVCNAFTEVVTYMNDFTVNANRTLQAVQDALKEGQNISGDLENHNKRQRTS